MTRAIVIASVFLATLPAGAQETSDTPAEAPASGSQPADRTTYLFSDTPLFEPVDDLLWDGFLTGMEGFDHHYEPISNPIYNESPFIETQLKFLYVHHEFPDGNAIDGGDADIAALQLRLALTDRLAFIATKDGYTWLDTGLTGKEEGFNDLAFGAKYALIVDHENDFVLTVGARLMIPTGDEDILMGNAEELSPFVSLAKGFGDFHVQANATYRIGFDNDTNDIFQWSIHTDYEIADGIAPVLELNGLHYVSDGGRLPLDIGALDYSNIGSSNVAGDTVIWAGAGMAFKLSPNVELGATYEFPLTDDDDDIIESRITVGLTFSY